MTVVTILSNATTAKLHEPSREVKLEVQRILSYMVAGAEQSSAFKMGNWDGRSSFLDFRGGTFPAGFVVYVIGGLRRKGYEVRSVKKPLPVALGPMNPVVDKFPEDPRYDYQMDVVRRLEKHGQIIAQVATGGGKSRCAKLAYSRLGRPTLFLTTRGILMYQMKDSFEADLGIKCSVLGDGQFGHVSAEGKTSIKKMCVGMVQTLMSRLDETTEDKEFSKLYDAQVKRNDKVFAAQKKAGMSKTLLANLASKMNKQLTADSKAMARTAERKFKEQSAIRTQTISLLGIFELVILEEAHEASGNGYFEILKHCKAAHYRLALTGTPFMKDDEEANMRLMASSGPIAIKVTEKMLIDRGILAKPYFKFIELATPPAKLHRTSSWDAAYRLGIVDNEERNIKMVNEALRGKAYGLSAMILVQQKRHGDIILALAEKVGLRAEYIQGDSDQAERKEALRKLATGAVDVLIGTTILDVGVDVPAVGMIILGGGGKAEVALRQRVGRGLRAKKTGPNAAFVVDFSDHWNQHTKSHAAQRQQIIKDTEGFGENVVANFDYLALGFEKVT